jgi:hypothetical protein
VLALTFAPLLLLIDKAHATEGLTAQVYNVQGQNNAPYIPQGASPVLTTNVPNIDFQWGSGSVLGGPSEDVIVRFTGSIRSNTTQNISFLATADDGTKLYIDGINITNDWYDKGGGGTISDPISFTAGVPKTIELLYYENGGGANVFLYWDQSGSMDIIPASAFTSQAAPVVKTIGAPRNLTVSDGATATTLTWEAPNTGNTQPERYAISFSADGGGWGIATGNVGDANALNTTITIPHSTLESLKPSGTTWTFSIRSDNDTNSLYSETSNQVTLKIGLTQEEKDAAAALALAAQQELDRQTAANTAVTNYENQSITNLEQVALAESLKLIADTATAIVIDNSVKISLQSRIDARSLFVSSTKASLTQAKLEAEAAALLAAQQEAARVAAEQEAARLAAIAAQAEADRIAAEQEAARQAAIAAEQARLAEIARLAAIKAEEDRVAAELAAQKAEAERLAAIEAARIQAENDRLAAEAAAKAEADRLAAEAAAKKAEEERIAAEIAKAKAEEEARLAEEARLKAEAEAKAAEEARIKAEAEAKAAEEARLKAEEEARLAEEARLKAEAEAKAKAEEEARLEAERIAAEKAAEEQREKDRLAEEARLKAEAEAKAKAEEDARIEKERIAAEEAKAKADKLKAEADKAKAEADAKKAEEERLAKIAEEAKAGKELSKEEVAAVVTSLVADLKPGESISAAQVQASGVSYSDLPASTPIEVRTSESGEVLVITAEVAANVELVTDAGALLEAAFTDPGAALAAIGSIGADMTEGEREEATDMVVATVVAAGAAMNAVGAATGSTGGSTSGGSSGGGSGGGGASGNSKGVRRRP